VDLLSKELNREQSESPRDSAMNKQWNQVSYNHQKTPNHQISLRTTDNIPSQNIPESANRSEILANLSTDFDNHKTKRSQSKKPVNTKVSNRGISHKRRITDSEVVKCIGRTCLKNSNIN
jgi:hypothetical protein